MAKQAAAAKPQALEELERLANEGDAFAAHYLGRLYLDGRGMPRSEALAIE